MQVLIVAKEVRRSVAYPPCHRFPVDDTYFQRLIDYFLGQLGNLSRSPPLDNSRL
jgi:hypothetical protein